MEVKNNCEYMNKKKWSHQRNGNYEGSMETNWRRSQKPWLLHSVSTVMRTVFTKKGIYLPIILVSCAYMKNKFILNTVFGDPCAPTSACFAIGSFVPMSFTTLHHWKTCLSSHNLSLISDCFLVLLLWLIIFNDQSPFASADYQLI